MSKLFLWCLTPQRTAIEASLCLIYKQMHDTWNMDRNPMSPLCNHFNWLYAEETPNRGDDNSPVIFLGNPVQLGLFNSYLVSTYYVISLGYNKSLSKASCILEILSLVKVMGSTQVTVRHEKYRHSPWEHRERNTWEGEDEESHKETRPSFHVSTDGGKWRFR